VPLEDATLELDIKAYSSGEGDKPTSNNRLFVILAANQNEIKNAVTKNQAVLEDQDLSYSYLLKPFMSNLAFYEEVKLDNFINTKFPKTIQSLNKVKKEGVYSLMFL